MDSDKRRLAEQLVQQVQMSPDLALVHQVGQLYYRLARYADQDAPMPQVADDWRQVIAYWMIVLHEENYWRVWIDARAEVYQVTINPDVVKIAREHLWQPLLAELTSYDEVIKQAGFYQESLAIQMQLEAMALRVLRSLPMLDNTLFAMGGPLLLRLSGLESALGRKVATLVQQQGREENWQQTLRHFMAVSQLETLSLAERLSLVMVLYSQLGGALVYLKQQQYAAAVNFLRHMACPTCSPPATQTLTATGKRAIQVCQANCPQFLHNNPLYAVLPDGWNRLWADTIQLAIEVCILGVRDGLYSDQPDVSEMEGLWHNAYNLAWYAALKQSVQQRLKELVLQRALALEQTEQWSQAARILEIGGKLTPQPEHQFIVAQAQALNSHGITLAKAQDWAAAIDTLRQAYQLTPQAEQIQDNLIQVLEIQAEHLAGERQFTTAGELLAEAESLLLAWQNQATSGQQLQLAEQLQHVQFKRQFAYQPFWQSSPLFNRAIAEANHLQQHYLGVAHLFLSLSKHERGLTQQTIANLGTTPAQLRQAIRQEMGMGDQEPYWKFVFFTPRLQRVLLRAISLAQARGTLALDEQDFLYAIIMEPDSLPMRTMVKLGLPVQKLPYWQPSVAGHQQNACLKGTFCFTYLSGPEDGKQVTLNRFLISIGRAVENDLVLSYDALVSRRHARVTLTETGFLVEDLHSSSGTYLVEGGRVQEPVSFSSEAVIKIGQTWLRLQRQETGVS